MSALSEGTDNERTFYYINSSRLELICSTIMSNSESGENQDMEHGIIIFTLCKACSC